MNKLTLSAVSLAIVGALTACDDGSGFTSTQNDKAETTQVSQSSAQNALRNMSQDRGVEIEAILAEGTQASPAGEDVAQLFDGNHSSKFLAFDKKATIIFKAAKAVSLKHYNFVSANDEPNRDPKNWVVYGSNDKSEWVEIDTRANESFQSRGELRQFELSESEDTYQYFKFDLVHGGTDSYGNDIVQLAELELFVVAEAPIVSFNATVNNPKVNEIVIFSDTSLVNPTSWHWTFEGGTPSSSTEQFPLVRFSELGPKTVTLVAANDKGETTLVKEDFIRVWDPENPWAGFPEPTITFTKNKPEHDGQRILERVMPELETDIQTISLAIAKRLFNNVTEINVFESVEFITDEYDFPAAKGGTDKHMQLMFDLNHIADLEGQGDQAIRDEILGVLWHELTHGYNNTPNSGDYIEGTDYHTYLESLANYIRIEAGYYESARANITWLDDINADAYNQTSFFLEWVVSTNSNIDFIKEFNASAKELDEWSFDFAFRHIFGYDRGLEVVLEEYQAYLKANGKLPPYPTPVEGHINVLQGNQVSVSTNASHVGAWGEGPEALFDNDIVKKFNAVIEAPWWVPEYLPSILPLNEIDAVNTDFDLDDARVVTQYSVASAGDNEIRFPSSWQVFGSNDGEAWQLLDEQSFSELPELRTTYTYSISDAAPYRFYRLSFKNERQGDSIGGDNGRLIQIGEIALWSAE